MNTEKMIKSKLTSLAIAAAASLLAAAAEHLL